MATLDERKAEYVTHETAGRDYYNSFRSQLTLDVEAGTKTLEQARQINIRMKEVADALLVGDWKNALASIQEVAPNVHCTAECIQQVKTDIQTYISQNYSW